MITSLGILILILINRILVQSNFPKSFEFIPNGSELKEMNSIRKLDHDGLNMYETHGDPRGK